MRRNLILLLVTLLVVFIPAELYLRAQAVRERARIRGNMDERALCTEASTDKRLLYTYTPGECGANSRGFRDHEHAPARPDGVFRIALIGDSVAEGRDVPPDSSFGRVLERMLNERGDGRRYEVILLARIGYSTSQEIVLLESEAPRYHPDLILWSYCLNDPAHPVYHNANGALGQYYYHPTLRLVALARNFTFRVKQKVRGRGCEAEFHAFLHCAFRPDVLADLHRIAALTRATGTPVAFVIHPVFEERPSFTDYSLAGVHDDLGAAALGAGFTVIDVLDAFRPLAPADLKVHNAEYFDPWHLNPRGHRVTAEFIADRLSAARLLP